jgi:hypothetical protein
MSELPEKYQKFGKMQKMGLPEGAIRQKMEVEGFTAAEMDGFFSGNIVDEAAAAGAPAEGAAPAAPAEPTLDEKYAKFGKMQKMNLPEGAIRQKMSAEGFADNEIDSFFNQTAPAWVMPAPAVDLSMLSDPKYDKYMKVKDMGVPEAAIRVLMMADGFEEEEIAKFCLALAPPPALAPAPAAAPKEPERTAADDERFQKFIKMKKMKVPDQPLRLKMLADGFTEEEIKHTIDNTLHMLPSTQKPASSGGGGGDKGALMAMIAVRLPEIHNSCSCIGVGKDSLRTILFT